MILHYWLQIQNEIQGPFEPNEIEQKFITGEILKDTMIGASDIGGKPHPDSFKPFKETKLIKKLTDKIILTTETSFHPKAGKRIGVITAECCFGINFFRDLFIDVRGITGGRSITTQKVLKDAREVILNELKIEALILGANAVIAIDIDYSEFGVTKMIFAVASGTAIRLSEDWYEALS